MEAFKFISILSSVIAVLSPLIAVHLTNKYNIKIFELKNQNEIELDKIRISKEKLELILKSLLKIKVLFTFTDSFINEEKYGKASIDGSSNTASMSDYHANYQQHKVNISSILAISKIYFTNEKELYCLIDSILPEMNLYWGACMNVIQCRTDDNCNNEYRQKVKKYEEQISDLVSQISKEVGNISMNISKDHIGHHKKNC